MSKFKIGVDLNPGNIGYSVTECDDQSNPVKISEMGVLSFPSGVEKKTGESINVAKRQLKSMRRNLDRRKDLKRKTRNFLKGVLYWPSADKEHQFLTSLNPYELRAKALKEKLTKEELSRVFYHFSQRRGYRHCKFDDGKLKESSKINESIVSIEREISGGGYKTLGGYFYSELLFGNKIRGRFTSRKMFRHEFDEICKFQRQFYPILNREDIISCIRDRILFYQRPLREQTHLRGKCLYEPKEYRCPKAVYSAQLFMVWQTVNNLKVSRDQIYYYPLTREQKKILVEQLQVQKTLSLSRLKSLLGLPKDCLINSSDKEGGEKELSGNKINVDFSDKSIFGKEKWFLFSDDQKDEITNFVFENDKEEIFQKAKTDWEMSDEAARKISELNVPEGLFNMSLKAIKNLLPFLKNGLPLNTALKESGYLDSFRTKRKISFPNPKDISNPKVRRCFIKVVGLINKLINKYDNIDEIIVECADDVLKSKRQLDDLNKSQNNREKYKKSLLEELKKRGFENVSSKNLLKYELWKEQNGICLYSGRPIPFESIFTSEIQIDHIQPYCRTYDSRKSNLVLTFFDINQSKANQNPFEYLSGDQDKWNGFISRIKDLKSDIKDQKIKNAFVQIIPDIGFSSRDLPDTRYIVSLTKRYLETTGCKVRVIPGKMTAAFRKAWQLDKDRNDLRTHSVDSLLLTMMTPDKLKELSKSFAYDECLSLPWDNFLPDLNKNVQSIKVEHFKESSLSNKPFDDGIVGKIKLPPTKDEKENFVYVKRKNFSSQFTLNDVMGIIDPAVKKIVLDRLSEKKIDINGNHSRGISASVFDGLKNKNGNPIKGARILYTNKSEDHLYPIGDGTKGYRASSENDHIVIYRDKKTGKIESDIIDLPTAQKRFKLKENVIKSASEYEKEGKEFIIALRKNDMVRLKDKDGKISWYRVQKFSSGGIFFKLHWSSNTKDKSTAVSKTPNTFFAAYVS